MNRALGSQIANENLRVNSRYWVKTRTLGQALVEIIEDCGVSGWTVEVVEGTLQSPVSKDRRWTKGKLVRLPIASVDRWYELAGAGE